LGLYSPRSVLADASTQGVPAQADCDSGSTTFTWDGEGITNPPRIATLSVDGESVTDPANPAVGTIGAAICPNVALGRRTGLFVFYQVNSSTRDFELSGAVTPGTSTPITADSEITITLTDMGELARYYSFSLVHGLVTDWQTTNLGTANATVSVTLKPVRTPFGNGSDFNFCTATPPNCQANKSDVDVISASLDMTFDQDGYGSTFAGSYFGLTGAMGGWVEATGQEGSRSLVATLGAPHFLANGSTRNTGSLQAFLPNAVLENLLGLSPGSVDVSTLAVTRTESGNTNAAPFTITAVDGGVIVNLSSITFSSPVYTISAASASSTNDDPAAPDTGLGPLTQADPSNGLALIGAGAAITLSSVYVRKLGQKNKKS
jgi:hypothetical protein